jgi:hypothetical protein
MTLVSSAAVGEEGGSRTPSPPDAACYLISPSDGQEASSPVRIVFGLRGMGVAPAGIKKAATGHHHLIIDAELPDLNRPIPADQNHRHFGAGQTETSLELAPGSHTLQLILGDANHIPHDPPVISERIEIRIR